MSPLLSILRARLSFTIGSYRKVSLSFISLPKTLTITPYLPAFRALATSPIHAGFQRPNHQPDNQWGPRNNDSSGRMSNSNFQIEGSNGGYQNSEFNQGYPNERNINQNYPSPTHGNDNKQNQAYGRNPSSNLDKNYPTDQAVPPHISDLLSLCLEGKVKEVIEQLDNGALADAECFSLLFQLIGNSKILENAKKVHHYFLRSSLRGDLQLNNKVLKMYLECGNMTYARGVFDHMPDRNMSSWHMMIYGYANNGLGDDGLAMFDEMRKLGLPPNRHTFLAVFEACASADAIEEGFLHFESMKTDYGLSPGLDHYLGLLGVLGKTGHLDEAEAYIKTLPFKPSSVVWEAMMNYARMHGDIDLEDRAEELMVSLDPSKAIANKIPTPPPIKQSAVNMLVGRNKIPEFRNPKLYKDEVKLLAAQKEQAYIPYKRNVPLGIGQEAEEQPRAYNSAWPAIAYGLITTPARTPVRITKNLRLSGNCHNASKMLSRIVGRELFINDTRRFHRFEDGKCSCNDNW